MVVECDGDLGVCLGLGAVAMMFGAWVVFRNVLQSNFDGLKRCFMVFNSLECYPVSTGSFVQTG